MPACPASGQSGTGMKKCRYRNKENQPVGTGMLRDRNEIADTGRDVDASGIKINADAPHAVMPDTQRAVNVNAEMRTEA
jgi:hypothetical protein